MFKKLKQRIERRYSIKNLILRRKEDSISELLLFWMHLMTLPGILLRFVLHIREYTESGIFNRFNIVVILIFLFALLTILFRIIRSKIGSDKSSSKSSTILLIQIGVDILFFSIFYFLTGKVESDFFIFYIIPILMAVEYLSWKTSLIVLTIVLSSFCVTVLKINNELLSIKELLEFLARICMLRSILYIIVYLVGLHYRSIEKGLWRALNAILDGIGSGISIIGKEDMRIWYMNDQQGSALPQAKVGGICYEEYNRYNRSNQKTPCQWCPVLKTFKDGSINRDVTHSPDQCGNVRHYDVVSGPLKDRDGNIIAAVELVNDVTDTIWRTSILDAVGAGISIISEDYKIQYMNEVKSKWSPKAKIGDICYKSFNDPKQQEPCEWCPVKYMFNTNRVETRITHSPGPDDLIRHSIVTASPLYDVDGRLIASVEIVNDITPRTELDYLVKNLNEAIDNGEILNKIMEIALKGMINVVRVDRCVLSNIDEDKNEINIKYQYSRMHGFTINDSLDPIRISGILSNRIKSDKYIEIEDLSLDKTVGKALNKIAQNLNIKSILIVPIKVNGQIWGSIAMESCDRLKKFGLEEIELSIIAAEYLGIAIDITLIIKKLENQAEIARILSHRMNPKFGRYFNAAETLSKSDLSKEERDYLSNILMSRMLQLNILIRYLLNPREPEDIYLTQPISLDQLIEVLFQSIRFEIEDRLNLRDAWLRKDGKTLESIDIQIQKELSSEAKDVFLPKSLLLFTALENLVINSVEAIFRSNRSSGRIIISVEKVKAEILIKIIDDGPGMADDTASEVNRVLKINPNLNDIAELKVDYKNSEARETRSLGLKMTTWIINKEMQGIIELISYKNGTVFQIRIPC
jgi:PAS domain-containing protein